jgi:hypothetical protein
MPVSRGPYWASDNVAFYFRNRWLFSSEYALIHGRNRVQCFNANGTLISDVKSSLLYPMFCNYYDSILDLKVHYIGQAFGKEGERLATERLAAHSTLQRIYSDILAKDSSKDPWLILWHFEPYYVSAMGSSYKSASIGFEDSYRHYEQTIASNITLDQRLTIVEAALIRYFSPGYNIEYKTTFPDNTHSSYSQCYDLDFNSVAVEFDTASICTRLWSEKVKPNWIHVASFFLHDEKVRVNMFKHI